jgi:CHASE1-domain containing sensor protein
MSAIRPLPTFCGRVPPISFLRPKNLEAALGYDLKQEPLKKSTNSPLDKPTQQAHYYRNLVCSTD